MSRRGRDDVALEWLSMSELRRLFVRRALSPSELIEHLLRRAARLEPELRAFTHLDHDETRRAAREVEALAPRSADLPPLYGVPISVKDLVAVRGMPFTRGSRFFEHQIASEDAPVVARLRAAGAIIFGKTTTSEFGWKAASSTRLYPETRNPWNRSRTAGGSSGGAAATVAAGLGPVSLGTDAGGSVRIPASFCGVFGLKPSLGRLPVYPPSPVGPLSHIGPLARSSEDAAMLMRVVAGADDRDVYSLPSEADRQAIAPAEGLRIGWSPDLGFMPVDPEIRTICERAVQCFRDARCEVIPVEAKLDDPRANAAVFFEAGVAMALAKFPNWRDMIDPDLVPVVERGFRRTGVEFAAAQMTRATLAASLARMMEDVDLLVTPTTPVAAFPAERNGPERIAGAEIDAFGWMGLTVVANLVGCPAASVPCGFTAAGLPVGLQIIGRRFDDWRVLRASTAFEEVSDAGDMRPELPAA